MKPKMNSQIQPQQIAPRNEQARQEFQNFLLAVDSYPDCLAKEPGLTFRQYLSNFFVTPPGNLPRRN
jgi:hypothetical protein